jgi:hypothetical protein
MEKKFINLDAAEGVFFTRQLENIKSKSYDVKYAELKARSILPVSFEAGPGANSITYRQYDMTGVAAIIANYAKDLPRADIKGKEFTVPVKSLGASYGYNVQEIRAGQMSGLPLEQRRANAAKRAVLQKENTIAFFGDTDTGLAGFINNSAIGSYTVPNDGSGSSTLWTAKTPDQIIRDLNGLAHKTVEDTKGVDAADTILLPLSRYNYIAATPRSANSDTTILEFFLKANPYIKEVSWLNELETAGSGSTKRMIAYRRSPDYVTLEIPQDFEQFPEQEQGLEYVVPCHSRIGGVILYYPLSVAKGDNI